VRVFNRNDYFWEEEQPTPTKPLSAVGKKKTQQIQIPEERVRHFYDLVCVHLQNRGTWKKTVVKFPPNAVYTAVRRVLERKNPDFDWDIFEHLREFSTINEFLEWLESEHQIEPDYEKEALEYAKAQLHRDAEALNKKIVNQHDRVISLQQYEWLKRQERELQALKRDAKGWPLSLL